MTLYAKYTKPNAGYDFDKEQNQKYLTLNQRYEVSYVSMGQSHTTIKLKDFPKGVFNSISFEFYHDDEPIDLVDFPEYNPYYYIFGPYHDDEDDADEE